MNIRVFVLPDIGKTSQRRAFIFLIPLCWVLVVAHTIFLAACGILALGPGIKPRALVLGEWSVNPWTTREVPKKGIYELGPKGCISASIQKLY